MSMKNSSDTVGFEASTSRFVAQYLNQLRQQQRVPAHAIREGLSKV